MTVPGLGSPHDVARRLLPDAQSIVVGDEIGGGMNNATYHLLVDRERLVLRVVDAAMNGDFQIDRAREQAAMAAAAAVGLAPEVVACLLPEGHMVSRRLDGPAWNRETYLEQVGTAGAIVRRVHDLPAIDGRFDPYADIAERLDAAVTRGIPLPDDLPALDATLDDIRTRRARALGGRLVVCHNDPWYENFRSHGDGTVRLLDWEFAGMGDPYFDIAVATAGLPPERAAAFIEAWGQAATPDLLAAVADLQFVFFYWNATWAVMRSRRPSRGHQPHFEVMAARMFDLARRKAPPA
ncbi:MAG: phosphotransferase [Actinobacteria bacterium]|nr:phosphotransferase [Actinomycetota bacterium]